MIALIARTHLCPPFCLFTYLAAAPQHFRTSPQHLGVVQIACKGDEFTTPVERGTSVTWGPPLPCKQALTVVLVPRHSFGNRCKSVH